MGKTYFCDPEGFDMRIEDGLVHWFAKSGDEEITFCTTLHGAMFARQLALNTIERHEADRGGIVATACSACERPRQH